MEVCLPKHAKGTLFLSSFQGETIFHISLKQGRYLLSYTEFKKKEKEKAFSFTLKFHFDNNLDKDV